MAPVHTRERAPTKPMQIAASAAGPLSPPRPIRFVTNNDEPLSKRRRISAACRTCQRRKTKCSGERPDCKTCLESDINCLGYPEQNQGGTKTAKLVSNRQKHQHADTSAKATKRSPRIPQGDEDAEFAQHVSRSPEQTTSSKRRESSLTVMITEPEQVDQLDRSQSGATVHDHPDSPSRYRNRVPYFRYFGPTAMVPGLKQMVVELNHHEEASDSNEASTPQQDATSTASSPEEPRRRKSSPASHNVPCYSRGERGPINPLIEELCEDFFAHLGCNYPFLTRGSFMRDLEEKRLDTILVDAVCAIAARFSKNQLLAAAGKTTKCDSSCTDRRHKSTYGSVFARRAMTALIDVFACPTLAAVQACLLLAYEQFGSDHDSGLWVYLGLSIRMAQDLGMQKLEGLRYEGHLGPTPKTAKMGTAGKLEEQRRADKYHAMHAQDSVDPEVAKEQRRVEKERTDTFWAIFFLDRVVSSGTGRPVSLRDKDIEISFPLQDETDSTGGWPAPFPALIRIIHSYGRVANLLNNMRDANQLTPEILKSLVQAEDELIGIYQRLSPKLHFSAANFQHYLKCSQATNFVLLHFWFHTLIVLLHQPSLLHSFEGRIQQLVPNSQELSLSSAKTIADILSFAELLDSKSFIGNPFTSQPMYFAACAFLLESASHATSRPQSRAGTPPMSPMRPSAFRPLTPKLQDGSTGGGIEMMKRTKRQDKKEHAKENLLAAAASHNYQRCYKALKALETYWAGTRYIVTVLDQKAKGSLDPLLYTAEYLKGAVEPRMPGSMPVSPAWRTKPASDDPTGASAAAGHRAHLEKLKTAMSPLNSARKLSSNHPIGWSLTGSSDSPDSNLSVLYQTAREDVPSHMPSMPVVSKPTHNASTHATHSWHDMLPEPPVTSGLAISHSGPPFDDALPAKSSLQHRSSPNMDMTSPDFALSGHTPSAARSMSSPHAEMLLPQTSTYSSHPPVGAQVTAFGDASHQHSNITSHPHSMSAAPRQSGGVDANFDFMGQGYGQSAHPHSPYNDMIIESQNIDTSALGLNPLLWLDDVPQDILDYFDAQNSCAIEDPLLSFGQTGPQDSSL